GAGIGESFAVVFALQLNGEQKKDLSAFEGICQNYGLVVNSSLHWEKNRRVIPRSAPAPVVEKIQPIADWEKAQIHPRMVRSGQKIKAPEALIIIGDVHAGAEVEAGGSVLILGSCQGQVRAGQKNAKYALIVAQKLKSGSLQIGQSKTEILTPFVNQGLQVAYLSHNQIKIEKYQV
ncbi:MAG: septum site-determining protein MinC, partial [Clostridia bacterium]|nr:septum site-determining protein MinC [Clostridia bacterium]